MDPDEFNKSLEELYTKAQVASSEGLRDEALKRCEEALMLIEEHGEEFATHTSSDFLMLMGDIYWMTGDYDEAFVFYHDVLSREPTRNDSRIATGVALVHLCRFAAARAHLEVASIETPDDAETWYYLAVLALRRGERDLAHFLFKRAVDIQDDRFFMPVEVEREEVVEVLEELYELIPEPLREVLKEIPVIIDDAPSDALLFSSDPPLDPLVLGLFEGTPLAEQSSFNQAMGPTQITLFLDNIWLVAQTREKLKEELWITLKHEIGHFLGLDEDELTDRGLA